MPVVSSLNVTTWSLSQRTPRLTCSTIYSKNSASDDSLSPMYSVGWKCPESSVTPTLFLSA